MKDLMSILPEKTKESIELEVKKWKAAGIEKYAVDFECNVCGETHEMKNCNSATRGGVPVVVCFSCLRDSSIG